MADVVHPDDGNRSSFDGARATPPDTLQDRFLDWRARMLQSPSFIRWATWFPLTRPLARAKTREMFDVVAGFVYTQIITACVEVGLLERLSKRSQTAAQLAPSIGLDEEGAVRLLRAAQALDLVGPRSGGRYGLGELGAALLGNPGVTAMIRHHRLLYEDLRDPIGLLKDRQMPTGLSQYWAYAQSGAPDALAGEDVGAYSQLMAATQTFIANEVLDAYPLGRHQYLMDVGGGEGRFAEEVLNRVPGLQVSVFDLPAVAERARSRMAGTRNAERFDAHGGDFFGGQLPVGADIISLVRILHDHDDDKALLLLRNVRAALSPGQKVLIAEPMANTKGAEKAGDAYFGFYLLAMRSGRPRTEAELREFLERTGFGRVRRAATANPLLTQVLVADAV